MLDEELACYMEEKKAFFTEPEVFQKLQEYADSILNTKELLIQEIMLTKCLLELLCFTIHTSAGSDLYLKILTHIGKQYPEIAQTYWDIFDNQENIHSRYEFV